MIKDSNKIIVTAVVCTFNRSQLLCNCLESLANQDASVELFEVIVVDNGSTDNTDEVTRTYLADNKHFRCVKEEQTGLSYARNRGWREASGQYVVYIDDDAEASTDWVSAILSFVVRYPDAVVFGGPYNAFSTDPVPAWFPPEYGVLGHGQVERKLDTGREFISGTNMAFRVDVLQACGGFHPDLGMKGKKISYGEETHLQILLHEQGHEIYYVPLMKVRHYLSADKMSIVWLLQSAYEVGKCWTLTSNCPRSLFLHFTGLAYGCVYAFRNFFNSEKMYLKRRLFYSLLPLVSEFGSFVDYFVREKGK